MKSGKTRAWLSWTALAVYALLAFVPVRGFVLCIGEDGHVALEAASAQASCFDCPTESATEASCCDDAMESTTGCACSDVPLQTGRLDLIRVVAMTRFDVPSPVAVGVERELAVQCLLPRGIDFRDRAEPLAFLRVPTNLILRV